MSDSFFCPEPERSFAIERARRVVLGEQLAHCWLAGSERGRTPLVGVHGLGSSFEDLIDVARQAGGPTLLVDLPGFGASARPERDYPVTRAVEAVVALLDALGIARPVWLGCSYGGHVALKAALDSSERVAGLVLVSSGGLDPRPPALAAQAFAERALAARSARQVRAGCAALVGRPNAATAAFGARRLAEHRSGQTDYLAVARSVEGVLADDTGARLEQVSVPVEVVHGDLDALVPVAVARAACARLGQARLTVLEGIGHLPWLEAPHAVAARVRQATLAAPASLVCS